MALTNQQCSEVPQHHSPGIQLLTHITVPPQGVQEHTTQTQEDVSKNNQGEVDHWICG